MSAEYPFIGAEQMPAANTLPEFIEYAWDFDRDTFINDTNGNHVTVTGNEAIKVWIYKALKTERYSYLAYSWQYGIELHPVIGKVMSVQERYSELKRIIVECLMVNPYIQSIDSITFASKGIKVTCDIVLTTVYGEMNINV